MRIEQLWKRSYKRSARWGSCFVCLLGVTLIHCSLILCSLWECPQRLWPYQKSLHRFLCKHYFLFCWGTWPLLTPLSHLVYLNFLLSRLPFSSISIFNVTHIHCLYKLFSLFVFAIWPYHFSVFLPSILPLHGFHHLDYCSCHIFHTHFHLNNLNTLSLHMPLSDDSFPQHAFLITVSYSMFWSVMYTWCMQMGGEFYISKLLSIHKQ